MQVKYIGVIVAVGIGFFIYASRLRKSAEAALVRPWLLKRDAADFAVEFIKEEERRLANFRWLGVALCALSVVPVIILDGFSFSFFTTLGMLCMFLMVAAGVMILIYTGYLHSSKRLLKVNARVTGYVAGR